MDAVSEVLIGRSAKSSGRADLDYLASRALQLAKLPPLPAEFTERALPVYLWFEYVR